jgi:uncharacterized protein (TIGR02284 family)
MNTIEKVTNALNTLLTRSYDAHKGYQEVSEKINNQGMSSLFTQIAEARRQYGHTLKREIVALGGTPDTGTSVKGDLHRTWIKIKDLFVSGDEQEILAECIRGEETTMENYRETLEEVPFAPKLREAIEKQFLTVKEDINHLKRLRNLVVAE